MKRSYWIFLILILLIAVAGAGWWFARNAVVSEPMAPATVEGVVQDDSGKRVLYWYDPMVPEQKFEKPGKSPFMDMELVPKYAISDAMDAGNGVAISSQTLQNLGIRTGKAAMASFGESLETVGRIEADERRMATVLTRVPGFVERLYLRAEGDPVKQGQKVAEVYAPELLAAQHEYLALLDYQGRAITSGLAESAKARLSLLGMTAREVAAITERRQPMERFGVYAPTSGIVSRLEVREGGQVGAGGSLMQITDLSRVWLIAEVPEQAVSQLKTGTAASLALPGLPGQAFEGRVSYLYPTLDTMTRTLPVRVELNNATGMLRPGMFGQVSFATEKREVLAVPAESVIHTGTRQVVILKTEGGFRPAEVVTGMRQGEQVEILEGLAAGEEMVLSGQFLVDSEASLSGVLARLAQVPAAPAPMTSQPAHDMAQQQDHAASTPESHAAAPDTQEAHDDPHAGHAMPPPAPAGNTMPHGTGKVVAVDAASGELKLAHDPIPALGWPAMTMGFDVMDNSQLAPLKPGDRVEFELMQEADTDSYHIHRIRKLEVTR